MYKYVLVSIPGGGDIPSLGVPPNAYAMFGRLERSDGHYVSHAGSDGDFGTALMHHGYAKALTWIVLFLVRVAFVRVWHEGELQRSRERAARD